MQTKYNRNIHVGILGDEIIPVSVLEHQGIVSQRVANFLLFIHELNRGGIV